jgi:FKBP-type peptidyl-prolyl cis-trans isomerase
MAAGGSKDGGKEGGKDGAGDDMAEYKPVQKGWQDVLNDKPKAISAMLGGKGGAGGKGGLDEKEAKKLRKQIRDLKRARKASSDGDEKKRLKEEIASLESKLEGMDTSDGKGQGWRDLSGDGGVMLKTTYAGKGFKPAKFATVETHLVGKRSDGKVFFSTQGTYPLSFILGDNKVCRGLEMAIMEMMVGESCDVVIKAPYAFGDQGLDDVEEGMEVVPPKETVTYSVSLEYFKARPGTLTPDQDPEARRLLALRKERESAAAAKASTSAVDPEFPALGETVKAAVPEEESPVVQTKKRSGHKRSMSPQLHRYDPIN